MSSADAWMSSEKKKDRYGVEREERFTKLKLKFN